MSEGKIPRPVVLCILDGWGERADKADNAILDADTPNWRRFLKDSPHAQLQASEHFVGLPDGQMGNSEVGHMNIGAGRVVMQDLPRIDQAVKDGSIARNVELQEFIAKVKKAQGKAHLMGLVSPGGVHAHQDHIVALAKTIAAAGIEVAIHAFLDGRDTPPKSANDYVTKFLGDIAAARIAHIVTVSGRYYAMDRDKRWDRVAKAYAALALAKGEHAPDAKTAIEQSYAAGKSDEFVLPTVIGDYAGMEDGDGVICANFRADQTIENSFGEYISRLGLTQLRIAETEKYAHVTFFFNGGREEVFSGESRILVPSPKVATYDLKPEMSAPEVTDKLVEAIDSGRFDVIVVNYANTDMVGHSGDLQAAIKAVEAVDQCLGRVADAVKRAGGTMLITADHGNAEMMRDPETGQPHTAHTTNPVPLLLVNPPPGVASISDGRLCDIAPTLLQLLGLKQPKAMTGHALVKLRERASA
jgi:2,3-bisphosphoglycerate-independent phosphoglycerate mutase